MPGWNTATLVLYQRLMNGTSRAIAAGPRRTTPRRSVVVGRRRRLVDQPIDLGVAVVHAVEAGRAATWLEWKTRRSMSGSIDADELRGVHLEVALDDVARAASRTPAMRILERDADAREILLNRRRLDPVHLRRRRLQRQRQPRARSVAVGIRQARRVEQPLRLRRVVAEVEHLALERPRHRRHDTDRRAANPRRSYSTIASRSMA